MAYCSCFYGLYQANLRIKSGRLWVRTVLGERVVQKHRIETLNENRYALRKRISDYN